MLRGAVHQQVRKRSAAAVASRRLGLAIAGLTLVVSGCAEDAVRLPEKQPNLLLLVIDCLRADHVGVNGYERETTPNLDRLAAEGVNFTRAFSQAQWTRPSLPALLTGLYPSEHGLISLAQGKDRAAGKALSPEVETVAEALKQRGYDTALIGNQAQLSRRFGLTQGFDTYRSNVKRAPRINKLFLEWAAAREGVPFFAYLHYLEIHWPYCPPGSTRGLFNEGTSDLALCKGSRRLKADVRNESLVLSDADAAAMMASYDEELVALDADLGRLFRRLKQDGLWDDTLIVVTSDHGEQFYERGTIGHKTGLFDELIRVPLIVKPPSFWGVPVGRSVDTLAELRDVAPTFRQIAGLDVRKDRHSLLPWILDRAESAAPRRYVVAESSGEIAVRTAELKLIANRDGGQAALFDLGADPGETENLATSRRADLALMREYLEEWREGLEPVTPVTRRLNQKTIEGLKALGYLD